VGGEDDVLVRRHYGAGPLHLLLHVAVFAIVAWVALSVADAREAQNIVLWFVVAIVAHDFLLLPFYSAIDRVQLRLGAGVNYVRVPLALSGLLFLMFFPAICGRNEDSFARVAGVTPSGYLQRWLLVVAVLFAASAVLYAVRGTRSAADASSAS
jgi:hypothetical protein